MNDNLAPANRIGKSLAARRLILGDGYVAQEDFHFGKHALRNRLASYRKRGRVRWMTMNHAVYVRSLSIDLQVKQRLTGSLLPTCNLITL